MINTDKLLLKTFLTGLLLYSFCGAAKAQDEGADEGTVIRQALAIPSGSFYRLGFFSVDPVEAAVIRQNFTPPVQGAKMTAPDGEKIAWKEIQADEKGWFRDEALRGGYVYVTLQSDRPETVLLEGMSHQMFWVNGFPRVGNRYQYKENFAEWEPKFDFSLIPVRLKKGRNDILFRCNRGRLKVVVHESGEGVFLNTSDITLPDALAGDVLNEPASVVVINATAKVQDELYLSASLENGETTTQHLPTIMPMTIRKVPFQIKGSAGRKTGKKQVHLVLFASERKVKKILGEEDILIRVVSSGSPQKHTFVSGIDGSVQYYAVNPAGTGREGREKPALVLSVHGAGVEAINQASAYEQKSWATIVCPTNRRPFGYDWEDWGRLDALEVLNMAKNNMAIDHERVYLTGHSMGGHGTWILGALYPDLFGAIGPSAGWISWWSYGARGTETGNAGANRILKRALNPANTFALMHNYDGEGIYIIHGSKDDNVPPEQSYRMVDSLKTFHHDFVFYEQAGAGHWWDVSDEPGADCVDWPPLFDFFARHRLPSDGEVRIVEFTTPNPGISATRNWLTIEQQMIPLSLSHVRIQFDPGRNRFSGTTENVERLNLALEITDVNRPLEILLDSQQIKVTADLGKDMLYLRKSEGNWKVTGPPDPWQKNPLRYGMFRDAFRNRMIFVIGTRGTRAENDWAAAKARYDAETFWYQGNGAVDMITDREFSPEKYPDRNVILYGNAQTNSAWVKLLQGCPVRVDRKGITFDGRRFSGRDLATFFIWPRRDSKVASVGVVAGTSPEGLRLTGNRPYLYAGFALPDIVIFDSGILQKGTEGIKVAGFFGNDWSVAEGDFFIKN